jgi:hypothetical protein
LVGATIHSGICHPVAVDLRYSCQPEVFRVQVRAFLGGNHPAEGPGNFLGENVTEPDLRTATLSRLPEWSALT